MQSHTYDLRKIIGYEALQPALRAAKGSEAMFVALVNLGTTSRVINECLMDCYKTMMPIEVIPKDEKYGLWNFAKERWPEATRQELKDKCLYIYIIGNLF